MGCRSWAHTGRLGAPTGPRGSAAARPSPRPKWLFAALLGVRPSPSAHLPRRAWGMPRGPFAARPRAPRGARTSIPGARTPRPGQAVRGYPSPLARRTTRAQGRKMRAGGAPSSLTAPPLPRPLPGPRTPAPGNQLPTPARPGRSYLVWARARARARAVAWAAEGERGWSARRRGGRAASVSLAPSRPAPALFNRCRPRADTPHGLTAWLRRPGQ